MEEEPLGAFAAKVEQASQVARAKALVEGIPGGSLALNRRPLPLPRSGGLRYR